MRSFSNNVLQQWGVINSSTQEVAFIRPNLTSNGTLGGSSFAVTAEKTTSDAWKAFDGTDYSNSYYASSPFTFIIYNPIPIKISKFTVANHGSNYTVGVLKNITVSGSSDNSEYFTLSTYTNSNSTLSGGKWDLPVNSSNYYKYYKIYATCSGSGNNGVGEFYITGTYQTTVQNIITFPTSHSNTGYSFSLGFINESNTAYVTSKTTTGMNLYNPSSNNGLANWYTIGY